MKTSNMSRNLTLFAVVVTALLTINLTSCNHSHSSHDCQSTAVAKVDTFTITENEVLEAQQAWSNGIVNIGKVFLENGDYKAAATEHINRFYNYQEGTVLFKPTLTSEKQFRTDFQGAFSYFVGGDASYPEDHGFAIKPWSAVRWENIGTKITGNMAVAMGNYYFTPAKGGDAVKVEYSFAYTKDKSGQLKIILHDSHLPYKPAEKH